MNPCTEAEEFEESNRKAETRMRARYATLVDGRQGVALTIGTYTTCLTNEGAIKLATMIVNAVDTHKKVETNE